MGGVEGSTSTAGRIADKAHAGADRLLQGAKEKGKQAIERTGRAVGKASEAFRRGYESARETPKDTTAFMDAVAAGGVKPVDHDEQPAPEAPDEGKVDEASPEAKGEQDPQPDTERAKTQDRIKNNFDKQRAQAHKRTDEAFDKKYPGATKNEDGTPRDPAQMAEYVVLHNEHIGSARHETMRATVVEQYAETNPQPDQNTNPEDFDAWAHGLQEELDATEQAEKELALAQKEAGPGRDEKAEKTNEVKEEGEQKIEGEASWGNAFKLASESLGLSDKEEKAKLEAKVNDINNRNPSMKPSFGTRVKAMKLLVVAGGMGLIVGYNATKDVTSDAREEIT